MRSGSGLKVLVGLLATTVAGVVVWLILAETPPVNRTTGCPVDQEGIDVTLSVLLDATDPFGVSQQRTIINAIWQEVEALAVHDRIRVFAVGTVGGAPAFDYCKPGRELRDSPVEQRLREVRFKEFLDAALEEVQKRAPIIASLGWVAASQERDHSAKRILLVSDLMENSDVLSHYEEDWETKYALDRKSLMDQCPMLEGVEVEVLLPTRPSEEGQSNVLVEWWIGYLRECGGTLTSIQRVTGVQ